jgi:hypothetical protein
MKQIKQIITSIDALIPIYWRDKCGCGDIQTNSNIVNNLDTVARVYMPISGDYKIILAAKNLIKQMNIKKSEDFSAKTTTHIGQKFFVYGCAAGMIAAKYITLYGLYQILSK